MKKKFKIKYPEGHEKAGQNYKPPKGCMVVMNSGGVFFLYDGEPYYPSIKPLSYAIEKYDVVWND